VVRVCRRPTWRGLQPVGRTPISANVRPLRGQSLPATDVARASACRLGTLAELLRARKHAETSLAAADKSVCATSLVRPVPETRTLALMGRTPGPRVPQGPLCGAVRAVSSTPERADRGVGRGPHCSTARLRRKRSAISHQLSTVGVWQLALRAYAGPSVQSRRSLQEF
jgi:hypothetical protein